MAEEAKRVRYHRRGIWYRDLASASLCYVPPGYYEEDVSVEPTIIISDEVLPALVTALDELGYIKPRLDERLREEDLKITHRLLDLLDKALDPPVERVILEERS